MGTLSDKQLLVASRQKARHYAVQALYQWKMNQNSWSNIAAQFLSEYELNETATEYFKFLLRGVVEQVEELDTLLEPCMDLKISELGPVELSILRMASLEMKECIDIPYRSVINESVNLAKKFAATDSYKYINAVLDKLSLSLRAIETGQ